MHDKYAYERIEMALHDYAPVRTMAFGIAGLSVVADSLSAIRYARVKVERDKSGLVVDYQTEGDFRSLAITTIVWISWRPALVSMFMSKLRKYPDLPQCPAYSVSSDHHLKRGVRQKHRPYARWTPQGRALRSRSQPDAWT